MKRFLPILPIFLLMLLNACGNTPANISPAEGTAVAQTQTATMWTPTITPIPDPNESKIVEWLNDGLLSADALEQALDASYRVRDVSFPYMAGSTSTIFRVDIRCECATDVPCCIPERMFVVTMWSMKGRADKIIDQVPGSVGEVKVVCYDHMMFNGVMAAKWSDVMDYLLDRINGYQLGSRVYRSSLP